MPKEKVVESIKVQLALKALMANVKYRYFFRKYPNFAVIYEK